MADLVEAVQSGNLERVRELIASGGDVNTRDEHGNTLLKIATVMGHINVVNALLAAGADPNAGGPGRKDPLSMAVMYGDEQIVDALLRAGANVDAVNDGDTPLIYAIRSMDSRISMIRRLIRAGANVNATTRGAPVIHFALYLNKRPEVEALLEAGADITSPIYRGKSILQYAAEGKYTPELKELLVQTQRTRTLRRRGPALSAFRSRKRSRRSSRRRAERQ